MRSALLACLPLTDSSCGNRVLSDFDQVCHCHGVSGKAFCVVADTCLAAGTTKSHCLPGFLFPCPDGHKDSLDKCGSVGEETGNSHRNGGEAAECSDWWEQGLGVGRVDCFSRTLEKCIREGLRSCSQLSQTLAKAARFYNYITSAVPPEKLSQVFDGPVVAAGGPGSSPLTTKDWAAQLKVLKSCHQRKEVEPPLALITADLLPDGTGMLQDGNASFHLAQMRKERVVQGA